MPEGYLLWKGRLMTGSHPKQLLRTFVIILLSWLLYVFLIAPFFSFKWLIPIAMCLFEVHCVFLCLTAFTEPGIIPRRSTGIKTSSAGYCNVCEMYRNSRARHCRYCDNCVDVFDHHCPWTGTCIGVRNYPYFFLFLISVTLSLWFVLLSAVILLVGWIFSVPTDAFFLRCVSVCVVIPWSLLLLLPTSLLLGFHTYLILTGQTTCEYFTAKRQREQQQRKQRTVRHVRYAAILQPHQQQEQQQQQQEEPHHQLELSLEGGTLSALFQSDDSVLSPEEDSLSLVAGGSSLRSTGSGSSAFLTLLCVMYPAAAAAAAAAASASDSSVDAQAGSGCMYSHCPSKGKDCSSGGGGGVAAAVANNSTLSSERSQPSNATSEGENELEGSTPEKDDNVCGCCRASRLPAMWESVNEIDEDE